MQPEPETPERARPRAARWRRALRIALYVLGGALALLLLVGIALRLYFSDERLRAMVEGHLAERLGTRVELRQLRASLFSGIELGPLRIGALPGYKEETVALRRLALHWSALELLRLRVVVEEAAVEGVRLTVEVNGGGSSLDALTRALAGAEPAAEGGEAPRGSRGQSPTGAGGQARALAAPPATHAGALEQPRLPVRVEIEKLRAQIDELRILRPDLRAQLDHAGAEGRFSGDGRAMDLDLALWLGAGGGYGLAGASRLTVSGDALPGRFTVAQRLLLTVAASGFADVKLGLHWSAETRMEDGPPLPPVRLSGDVALTGDLLAQTLAVTRCEWSAGDRTHVAARGAVDSLLDHPRLRVEELAVHSDLSELEPLVAALVAGAQLAGDVRVEAQPFEVPSNAGELRALEARVAVAAEGLTAALPGASVQGLDLHATLATAADRASVHLETKLARAAVAGQEAAGLAAVVDATTPLGPWLGVSAAGAVDAHAHLSAAAAGSAFLRARRLNVTVAAAAPVALLRGQATAEPITAEVRARLGSVQAAAGTALRDADMRLEAKAYDLDGARLEAAATTRIGEATVQLGPESTRRESSTLRTGEVTAPNGSEAPRLESTTPRAAALAARDGMEARRLEKAAPPIGEATPGPDVLRLENTTLELEASRAGEHVELRTLRLATAGTLELRARGVFDRVLSQAPRLSGLLLEVEPVDLARAVALLPESMRPPVTLAGRAGLTVTARGNVPYRELMRHAPPPAIEAGTDPAQLARRLADFVQSWRRLFDRGLPFGAEVALKLDQVAARNEQLDLQGVQATLRLALAEHQPSARLDMDVDTVRRPLPAAGVHAGVGLALEDGDFAVTCDAVAARAGSPELLGLADEASAAAGLRYRMGGDLLLERFHLDAPRRGARVEASGVVSKPLQLVLARSWERPGLPGLDATLRWSLGLDAGEMRPLARDGPSLGGALRLTGNLRAARGVVGLDGSLTTRNLQLVSGETAVEGMTGELPFDLGVTFDPRPDATVIRRNVGVGSGVLAVITDGGDTQGGPVRPAYYERLRSYRRRSGLTARRVRKGPHEISSLELEGRVAQGSLLADRIAMHLLGGDVVGNLALQLGRDPSGRAAPRLQLAVKASNIDASYFEQLGLEPGPQSELSADLQLGVLLAPRRRDLTLNMNVTKIGTQTFDRFLQLLDPAGTDEKVQDTRGKLRWVRIDNVALWVRHENLNMNLAVTTFLRIPGTQIGFPHIPRELPRFSLTDRLDAILGPLTANLLAPMLGWSDAS